MLPYVAGWPCLVKINSEAHLLELQVQAILKRVTCMVA
jgi:hypothetical protein